jgi:RHS repeat-associated protein
VETKDENGVKRIVSYGALGQIDYVCEISSNGQMPGSGTPVDCGLDIPGTGFLTQYGYDIPNHTMIIAQGDQLRAFQTDSLGRSIVAVEPERGPNTTYTYTYSTQPGLGLTVLQKRGAANQADPSTLTTTTTQYDSIGRVVSVAYSDGTPTKNFGYDAPSTWTESGQQTNLKGHLSWHNRSTAAGATGAIYGYDAMGRVTLQYSCTPSTCGNAGYDRGIVYGYNTAGMLTSEGDGAGGNYTYQRSPAGEITGILDSASLNIIVPGSVQNTPFGPTSYIWGNNVGVVNAYDSMGRPSNTWVCAGSLQPNCAGGGQIYGYFAQRSGTHVTQTCDTVLSICNSFGYDEFNRLTARTVTQGTGQNYTYTYDRYGNRWAQNAPQGGYALSISMDPSNNIINTPGYANDVPGNIVGDGNNSYTYDADGNVVVAVDSSQTANYYYDSLNQRVRIASTSNPTSEFVWDASGRRVSTWSAANQSLISSNIYTDAAPLAIRTGGQTEYEAMNWLGTERAHVGLNGATVASMSSLPWGDGLTLTGSTTDEHDFALLDLDLDGNAEHAQNREYSTALGRWLSPDSYYGSYDFTNPQTFNRYTYANNDPANLIDPSGQCLECVAPICGPICGAIVGTAGGILELSKLLGWWGGPSFHGSLQPRPSTNIGWDGNFGESLGIPTTIPQGNLGLGMALGLPAQGCEFGACGTIGDSFQEPVTTAAGAAVCIEAEPCGIIGGIILGGGLIYQIYMSQHGRGEVGDTGVTSEAHQLIAQGLAKNMCDALAILLQRAQAARDTQKLLKIKKTRKYYGCAGSRSL